MNEDLNVSPPNKGGITGEGSVSVYSTEETQVGTWINNEPIYRRVVICKSPTNIFTESVYDGSELNIDEVIYIQGIMFIHGTSYIMVNSLVNSINDTYITYNKLTKTINQKIPDKYYANKDEYIIIEYTKSENQSEFIPEKITTSSGRKIWRHPNDYGSVIEFDMYSLQVKMFVADPMFWNVSAYSTGGNDVNAKIDRRPSGQPFNSSSLTMQTLPVLTDGNLQSILGMDMVKSPYAKELCDEHLAYVASVNKTSPALEYTRSLTQIFEGGLDIPNVYETAVIFQEGDYLNQLMEGKNTSSHYIGYNESTKTRMSYRYRTSSTSTSTSGVCSLYHDNGSNGKFLPDWDDNVSNAVNIPIKELDI